MELLYVLNIGVQEKAKPDMENIRIGLNMAVVKLTTIQTNMPPLCIGYVR
jgi:hypothetical protein